MCSYRMCDHWPLCVRQDSSIPANDHHSQHQHNPGWTLLSTFSVFLFFLLLFLLSICVYALYLCEDKQFLVVLRYKGRTINGRQRFTICRILCARSLSLSLCCPPPLVFGFLAFCGPHHHHPQHRLSPNTASSLSAGDHNRIHPSVCVTYYVRRTTVYEGLVWFKFFFFYLILRPPGQCPEHVFWSDKYINFSPFWQ